MQTKNRNHVVSTGHTKHGFFNPVIVTAALSLCLPFGGAYGQSADAAPDSTGTSRTESQTPADLTVTQALHASRISRNSREHWSPWGSAIAPGTANTAAGSPRSSGVRRSLWR